MRQRKLVKCFHSLRQNVELFGHLHPELLPLESVSVPHDSAEVTQKGGDVRQQHSGALA